MADSEERFEVYPHTQVKRGPKRAEYNKSEIYAILDEAWLCHVGGVVDGRAVVQPNLHWRIGNTLYLHGSAKNRVLNAVLASGQVCITVALLDGLVLARSAFHHSVNYRSVMIYGEPRIVDNTAEAEQALAALIEKVESGRYQQVRAPNNTEMKATLVIAIELEQVSAKVRTGMPIDDDADMDWPVWAGVVPVTRTWGAQQQDPLQLES